MRRREKLTLLPNCLPFPVSSQRAAILFHLTLIITICISIALFCLLVKVLYNRADGYRVYSNSYWCYFDFDDTP